MEFDSTRERIHSLYSCTGSRCLWVLDEIQIRKEYIGKGYCIRFINKIIEYLQFVNANYIALIPAKRTEEGVVQNDERVIEFYIKNGFKPLSRRVGGYVVMGKSLL